MTRCSKCGRDDERLCILLRRERDEAREDAALSHKQYADVSDELAELRARVKEVPRTTEWHIAMRYANQIRDADAYFAARAEMLDSGHNRHLFEAGYQRGSDAGEKVYAGTVASVPDDAAKNAERYRLIVSHKDFAILYQKNALPISQVMGWREIQDDDVDAIADTILAAKKEKGNDPA